MTSDPARAPLIAGFKRACEARPEEVSEQVFTVAGAQVYARVAGNALARTLRRALVPDGAGASDEPDLTLELWDEAASGVPLKPAHGEDSERPTTGGEQLAVSADGRHVRIFAPDLEIRFDRDRRHAVGWVRSDEALSPWQRTRPLNKLFLPWLTDRGLAAVHAAMVARDGRGVVLAGPSRSGKSTSAAACALAGFDVLGDESTALELSDEGVLGHCMHAAVKLRTEEPGGETVLFLGEEFPAQALASARVGAIAFPELGDAPETVFEPIGHAAAMRALIACMLSLDSVGAADRARAFGTVSAALERVPVYGMRVGTQAEGIPRAIDALLGSLAGAQDSSPPAPSSPGR